MGLRFIGGTAPNEILHVFGIWGRLGLKSGLASESVAESENYKISLDHLDWDRRHDYFQSLNY